MSHTLVCQIERNRGAKFTQRWNIAGQNCTNKLRLYMNALSITSFRALQVCAWNVAHPVLPDRNNRGVKLTQHWNSATQLQKQIAQMSI